MMSRNLCLFGMMGTGKTTIARILGQRLGRRVADTDEEIRRWTGRSIPELFAEHGEGGFRDLERQVVEKLANLNDLVVALGGGTVLRDDNVASLALTGVLVHLDAPVEILAERLADEATDRPLLAGDVTERLAATSTERAERYASVADVTIDATVAPDEVADAILAWSMQQGDVLTPSEHEQVMP